MNGSSSGNQVSKTWNCVTDSDFASLFKCPVCFNFISQAIHQCCNGHLICSGCKPCLSSCPTCRGEISRVRNLAMEKVGKCVRYPCKYAESGCPAFLVYPEKTVHEEDCDFRHPRCPYPSASCKWFGSLDQLLPHFVASHKITTDHGEDVVFVSGDISLSDEMDWVFIQSSFGHSFMVVLGKRKMFEGHQFFALVQLIGSREEAQKFLYQLQFKREKLSLTWEATPRCIHEGSVSDIFSSGCLMFPGSVAELLAEDGQLQVRVTISEIE